MLFLFLVGRVIHQGPEEIENPSVVDSGR